MLATLSQPRPHGWEVVFLAPVRGRLAESAAAAGVEVVDWDVREDGRKPPPEWAVVSLRAAVESVGADLVHANSLSLARLTGRLAREDDRPATAHLRDIMRLSKAAVADVNGNHTLLAVSPAVEATHREQGVERIRCVPNGIEPFRRTRPPGWLRSELGVARRTKLIATVGQIGLRKGLDLAAAALRQLDPTIDFRWLVVGERLSQKEESVAFDAALDDAIGSRMLRLGYRTDVLELLAEVDLLLHPARQEPLGRVLLEAAEARCPVVGLDVGGNRFALPDSPLVPLTDAATTAAGLKAAVESSLADPVVETPASGRFALVKAAASTWTTWQAAIA